MIAKYDSFNRFETPKITLCMPGAEYNNGIITKTIGVLSNTSDEEIVANFNEQSSLNFVVYKTDESEDPLMLYDKIMNRQCVFVDNIGFFIITDVEETIDSTGSYKSISADSCESEIQNREMPATFYSQESNLDYSYNTTYKFDTLLELLVAAIPLWGIEYIDPLLTDKYRTFEDVSEDTNILAFMLKDMQDAYECIFLFDTIHRRISVYDQSNYVHETSIHLSNDDIVRSISISEESDDLYTSISVFGEDELTISGINPIGTNTIYRYDYYLSSMPEGLATKVSDWQEEVKSQFDTYYTLNESYYVSLEQKSNTQSELSRIASQLEMYQRCKDNIVASSGLYDSTLLCFVVKNDVAAQVTNVISEYNESGLDIAVIPTYSETLKIVSNTATLTHNAAGDPLNEITALYIIGEDGIYSQQLTQSDEVSNTTFTYTPSTMELSFKRGEFADNTEFAVFYRTDDQGVSEDTLIVTDILSEINDEIASLTFAQSVYSTQLQEIELELATIGESIGEIRSAVSMDSVFTTSELEELSLYTFEGSYTDEYVTITDSMTYPQRLTQMRILYDRAASQLEKISEPTEQFSLDVENFIFQNKFVHFTDQLETGCLINVEIHPNDIAQLFLSSFNVNFEDATLSMTFGNRYNKFDTQSLFEDVLGNISKTANSISFVKDTLYPITSGEFNEIKEALETIRTLSAGQALASSNQSFIIDSNGITGKQATGDSGFYPEQLKIVNNMIAMTDDAWETCKIAIGKILLSDGNYRYGINAEVLMGDILIGNELHILSQDDNGNAVDIFTVMQDRIEAHVPEIHAVTTNTGYTFNDNGLLIQRYDSEIINTLNNEGMQVSLVDSASPEEYTETLYVSNDRLVLTYPAVDVSDSFDITVTINDVTVSNVTYNKDTHTILLSDDVYSDGTEAEVTYYKGNQTVILTAKNDGVATKNLTAREFLCVGNHARFENYDNGVDENRTACFYI